MIRGIVNTKLKLRSTVLISVGSLVLLSVGSMLLLHLLTTKSIVSDLTGRLVKNNLGALELALHGHLNPAKIQAEFIAEAIRSGELEFNDREMLAEFVRVKRRLSVGRPNSFEIEPPTGEDMFAIGV